ncbi:hypothetical protein ACFXPS_42590 [Nocardia sp. NPDC059091]|uniref:hypothetical protein n=1 Tax=unclassified Nocardia TaxID=2637762 RepID=UPI00367FAD97
MRTPRPKGARYSLTVLDEKNLILYPWKYADNAYAPMESAKMNLSDVRKRLLALGATNEILERSLIEPCGRIGIRIRARHAARKQQTHPRADEAGGGHRLDAEAWRHRGTQADADTDRESQWKPRQSTSRRRDPDSNAGAAASTR